MRVRGELVHDAHSGLDLRVRRVHDAERRLAARDEGERGAHVVGAHEPVGDVAPHAERGERRARVAADRDVVGIAGREPARAERLARARKPGAILSCDLLSAGAISTSRLPSRSRRVARSIRPRACT